MVDDNPTNGAEASSISSNQGIISKNDDATSYNCITCSKIITDDGDDAVDSVQCIVCEEWSHVNCTMSKKVFDLLASIDKASTGNKKLVLAGTVSYICDPCMASIRCKQKGQSIQKNTSLQKNATTSNLMVTHSVSNGRTSNAPKTTSLPLDSGSTLTNQQANPEISRSSLICSYFKKGKCRHGLNGKKIVNGRQCSFRHPKKCIKFCKYGNDIHKGCAGGCGYFHPIICRNSLNYGQCFLSECTFNHLVGTQRSSNSFSNYGRKLPNDHPMKQINFPASRSYKTFSNQNWSDLNAKGSYFVDKQTYNQEFPSLPVQHSSNGTRKSFSAFEQEKKIDDLSFAISQIQGCLAHLLNRESRPDHQASSTLGACISKNNQQTGVNFSSIPLSSTTQNGSETSKNYQQQHFH